MTTIIRKWGNSLALRLPRGFADAARLREGTKVELVPTKEGMLVKAKRKPKPRYSLSELLAGIMPDNVHQATNWGPPVGREVIE